MGVGVRAGVQKKESEGKEKAISFQGFRNFCGTETMNNSLESHKENSTDKSKEIKGEVCSTSSLFIDLLTANYGTEG
ncbi:hypothetical protein I79_017530 [Cricetulus griseus]|uniref:Uncharacterized protein n=1 Tax=Cricetulus griseus TaxID=10029 RepID=G3I2A1_CRIGR|nr:hypothetical protein I79_017530 [Cricetulus griseus]